MPPTRGRRKKRTSLWTRKKRRTTPRKETWEEYLQRIYFDPRHPGSFKGPDKLFEAVREEGKHRIGLAKIRQWLKKNPSYSLYKPVRRKFNRLKVVVKGLKDQYEADLADMQKLKKYNDGTTFLLVVIDVFSRFLWVEPLRSKSDDDVVNGFRRIFERAPKPRRLRTDMGKEFMGQKTQDYFDRINVEQWAAHNEEMKANFAERVIRTLKSSLWGYMRQNKKYRYIDVLQDLVHAYNNTTHRSIGMKPSAVTPGDVEERLWWHLYKPKKPYIKSRLLKRIPFLFKKGDHVRISHKAATFERAYDEKWTAEIFIIRQPFTRLGIKKYRLNDLKGEELKGTFYEGELQKVTYSEEGPYDIEKIIETKGKGNRRQHLVKWKGWPEKFNSWISHSQLVEYRQEEPEILETE